jgi:hypothetical protein
MISRRTVVASTRRTGLLVIRDRNAARAVDTLLRYRGSGPDRAVSGCLPPGADSTERTLSCGSVA